MDSSSILGIVLFVFLIIINFIMYCFGEASQNVSDNELNSRAVDGDKRATKVIKIVENPKNFVLTIQVMTTTFAVLSGAYNIFLFSRMQLYVRILALVGHIGMLICFGVIIPQYIGRRKPEKWALRLVDGVRADRKSVV